MADDTSNTETFSESYPGSREVSLITDAPIITHFSDTKRYLGDEFTYTMATLNMILGLQALLLNIFVMGFYFKKRKETVPLMYLFVSSTDFLTAVSAVLISLILFFQKHWTQISIDLVLPAYALYSVTFKVSVFLNLTIAVARTINIIQPFYRIKNRLFVIATLLYSLGWIIYTAVQITLERGKGHVSLFDTYLYTPGQYLVGYVSTDGRLEECRNAALFICLPYLLPSLVVVVCMAVQARTLLKLQPEKTTNTETQKNITTTIFMMTVLFFVCNTVYVVNPITICKAAYEETDIHTDNHANYLKVQYKLRFLTGVVAPFVNAAFNPLILIARGTALKAAITKNSRKLTGMGRPSRTSAAGVTVLMNMNSITEANGGSVVSKRDSRIELSVNATRNSRAETSLYHKDSCDRPASKVTFCEKVKR
ncbi:hypothetical protein ACHWQZ_G008535 [Mnemiopsis leidyi]